MRNRKSTALYAAVSLILTMLASGPAASGCAEDLAATDASFEQTMAKLELVKDRTPAEKCAAYRFHVRVMEKAREVFRRCNTGLTQRENIGQMSDSIADFEEVIAKRCQGQ